MLYDTIHPLTLDNSRVMTYAAFCDISVTIAQLCANAAYTEADREVYTELMWEITRAEYGGDVVDAALQGLA